VGCIQSADMSEVGICGCSYGYKLGLKGTDCVPNVMEKFAGEVCYDTSQCYYSLSCVQNKCDCYSGFKPSGRFDCVSRRIGDPCLNHDDCQLTANSECKS